MTITTYPNLAPALKAGNNHPFVDMMSKVSNVYSDSMQTNAGELWMSSARIVQEHTTRAMVQATQECIAALAQNAAAIQQRSFARLGTANQQALEIMTAAFTSAMTAPFKPLA
jgi:fibrillarin-like rRNA methylase